MSSPQVQFDPEKHLYTLGAQPLVSVTQLLKFFKIANFDGVPEEEAEYFMERGTEAHRVCEMHDNEELDEGTVDPRILPGLYAWKSYRTDTGFEPILVEHQVHCPDLLFAGRLDRTGQFPKTKVFPAGSKAVLDLKFTDGAIKDWVGMQLAVYLSRLHSPRTYRRIALRCKSDGTYQQREFPPETYLRDLNCFLGLVNAYNWIKGARVK